MKTEIMEEMDSVCHKRETVGSDQTWEELESGKVSNTSKELNSSKNYSYTIDYREAFEEINRIPVMDILNRFGYQTFRTGNKGVLGIYENGKKTRGHIVNVRDNYVRDFTEKRRFCGQPVALIKRLYKAST